MKHILPEQNFPYYILYVNYTKLLYFYHGYMFFAYAWVHVLRICMKMILGYINILLTVYQLNIWLLANCHLFAKVICCRIYFLIL